MMTHHALNELWLDDEGCCLKCCAPCAALKILDDDGILDFIVKEWQEYDNGLKVFREDTTPWFKDGQVDRTWLYAQWALSKTNCCELENAE